MFWTHYVEVFFTIVFFLSAFNSAPFQHNFVLLYKGFCAIAIAFVCVAIYRLTFIFA